MNVEELALETYELTKSHSSIYHFMNENQNMPSEIFLGPTWP